MTVCIKSLIKSLNIVIGCPVGCPYCYARCSCARYRMTDDFERPEFFERKLRIMDTGVPTNFMMTAMSDLAYWKLEWVDRVFSKMAERPENNYVFLTKRPDRLSIPTGLDCAWVGVTVTSSKDLHRIGELRANAPGTRHHVTFEPLFDDPGEVDLDGIEWIVVGTETGRRKGKAVTDPEWALSLTEQAHDQGARVFMKEDLLPIMGEERMVQELPPEFMLPEVDLDG